MNKSDESKLPSLRGEFLYIPFVGAIIERTIGDKKQVLIQIREKDTDPIYSGSLEIPGGKFRAFEDIYDTLKREVREECGLEITSVEGEDHRHDFQNRDDLSSLIEPFCVTQMAKGPFIGMIFKCQANGEPVRKTNETKEARWIDLAELVDLVNNHPEKIYTAFLGPLKKYISLVQAT